MYNEELITKKTIERVRNDNCFDFLRYFFAFSLILVHFCTLTKTEQFWFISGQLRVKAFFTITGFLVVYSFLRRKQLNIYIWKRVLRIIPAYITAIFLCYIVGFFFSTASATEYYLSAQSFKYLLANLSFLNFIEPCLPGLFTENPVETSVNGSLWSMKYEVIFYILVPFIIWLIKKYSKFTILIVLFLCNILFHGVLDYLEYLTGDMRFHIINNSSPTTMIYFFSGTAILFYFDWFCQHIRWILPICFIYIFILQYIDYSLPYYIEPLAFSALIVGIAYFCKPLNFLQKYDNISYGLYLYHYPIIQVLTQYQLHQYNIYLTFILTLLITILLATASWYFIEKRLLKLKLS